MIWERGSIGLQVKVRERGVIGSIDQSLVGLHLGLHPCAPNPLLSSKIWLSWEESLPSQEDGKDVKQKMLERVKKREPSHTVGGNVNWCSYHGEQYGCSLKN